MYTPSRREHCSATVTAASGSPCTMRALYMCTVERRKCLDKQTACRAMRSWHSLKIEKIMSGLRLITAWIAFGTLRSLPSL